MRLKCRSRVEAESLKCSPIPLHRCRGPWEPVLDPQRRKLVALECKCEPDGRLVAEAAHSFLPTNPRRSQDTNDFLRQTRGESDLRHRRIRSFPPPIHAVLQAKGPHAFGRTDVSNQ